MPEIGAGTVSAVVDLHFFKTLIDCESSDFRVRILLNRIAVSVREDPSLAR